MAWPRRRHGLFVDPGHAELRESSMGRRHRAVRFLRLSVAAQQSTAIVAAIAATSATAINFLNFIILKSSVLCVFIFSFLHGLYHIKWL